MLELLNCPVPEFLGMNREWGDAVTLKYASPASTSHSINGDLYGIDLEVYNHLGALIYTAQGGDGITNVPFTFTAPSGSSSLRFRTKIRPEVSLLGTTAGLAVNLSAASAYNINEITDIEDTKLRRLFITYADKLTIVPVVISPRLRYLRFIGATVLNHPNISQWDTSNLILMANMFSNCSNFNQPLSSWNTSNVTSMGFMFSGCSKFNQTIVDWDVRKITNLSSMFSGCTVYNQNLSAMVFSASATRTNYDSLTPAWLPQNKPKFTGT